MSRLLVLFLILGVASLGLANEEAVFRGGLPKDNSHVGMNPGFADAREGGETIETAFPIGSLPFTDTGNTCDNIDNYDEVCDYSGSTSEDVVYSYVAVGDNIVMIDLCLSSYDTKVYVYENMYTPGNPFGCNDDFYFDPPCASYSSYLEIAVTPGNTYYIVVDGWGGDCGTYHIDITSRPNIPCVITCDPNAVEEGEPDLVVDYVDMYNGGCNSTPNVFQEIDWVDISGCAHVDGVSGWFPLQGSQYRDTDWYEIYAAGTEVTVTIETDNDLTPTRCMMTTAAPSCGGYGYSFQSSVIAGCAVESWTVPTTPTSRYWVFVAPAEWIDGPLEFQYCLEICGIIYDVIPTRAASWGTVKSLYK